MTNIEDMRYALQEYFDEQSFAIACADWPDEHVLAIYDLYSVISHEKTTAGRAGYLRVIASLVQNGNKDWQEQIATLESALQYEKEQNGAYVHEWADDFLEDAI